MVDFVTFDTKSNRITDDYDDDNTNHVSANKVYLNLYQILSLLVSTILGINLVMTLTYMYEYDFYDNRFFNCIRYCAFYTLHWL